MNIIGIDFGTSTSVMRVRNSREADADRLPECKPVTMSQSGEVTAPTLIRVNGDKYTYGHDASRSGKGTLYSNFKLLIRSNQVEERELGIHLLNRFFTYLYSQFESQKYYLFTDPDLPVTTKISYPSQWNEIQKESVMNAARLAGFPNVTGMDEASAGVNCILTVSHHELENSGFLKYGEPLHILLIDMGAGTTDLAFVKLTVTEETKTEILGTWPPMDSSHIFGGSHIDARFTEYLKDWLHNSGLSEDKIDNILSSQAYQIKQWKEQTVSSLLEDCKTVEDCSAIENIISLFVNSQAPMPPLNRHVFEEYFTEELKAFTDVIRSAPQDMREKTDLVFLTGGNSSWYWIQDILCHPDTGLPKIIGNPRRIMKTDLPNETVSRGMIYPPAFFTLEKPQGVDCFSDEDILSLNCPPFTPLFEQAEAFSVTSPSTQMDEEDTPSAEDLSLIKPEQKNKNAFEDTCVPSNQGEKPESPEETADTLGNPFTFPVSLSDYDLIQHYQNRISAGFGHTVAIMNDRTVLAAGSSRYGQCYMLGLNSVISVGPAEYFTAFLREDGKVDIRGGLHKDIRKETADWENIIAISSGSDFLVGLTSDGKVLESGRKNLYCLDWSDIIAISAGYSLTAGLKRDGSVLVAGDDRYGYDIVSHWQNIRAITVGYRRVIGLTKDGTVVTAGNTNDICCKTDDWQDIVAVSAGFAHTVGLKKDGSVVAAGYPSNLECRVSGWQDIIAISAGYDYTIGLKKDGTLVSCGKNKGGRCKIEKWALF